METVAQWMSTAAAFWAKRAVLACALLLGAAGVASADVTYTYTGSQPFNVAGCADFNLACAPVPPGPPGNGPLTLSFTVPTALAPGLGTIGGALYDLTSNVATTPTSFSINDGKLTLSGPAAGVTDMFLVATDKFGNILQWDVIITEIPPSAVLDTFTMSTQNFPFGNAIQDGSVVDVFLIGAFGTADTYTVFSNRNAPGAWTLPGGAATPEPSSLLLLATGLIAAAAFGRRLLG
jgi:hypothetical protein